ncbi:MAG: hypothetical protein PHW69_09910 [Elusimicrobiaceae bacterium]|nr:hypothetical protein [Elusimicrobiaceae bacterium]
MPKDPLDLTASFHRCWDTVHPALPEKAVQALKKHKIILVPGFMSRIYTEPVTIMGVELRLGNYFDEQMHWLNGLGVSHTRLKLIAGGFFEKNAEHLVELIRDSEYPVIALAHSRGGLDTLEALRKMPPLADKVAGVITIQSPFHGTPVADYVHERDIIKKISRPLLTQAGETATSIYWLTTDFRKGYLARNKAVIAEIVKKVPFICAGSHCTEDELRQDSTLKLSAAILRAVGILEHDGLVNLQSTRLPGAQFVALEKTNHRMPVTNTGDSFDRVRFTRALLFLLLETLKAV